MQDLTEYDKICTVENARALFDGSINPTNGKEAWVPVVNNITIKEKVEEDQLPPDASDKTKALATHGLLKIQKQESLIKRLFDIKSNGIKVDKADRQKKEN